MSEQMSMIESVARAICKSRTCEGINCCQWPCNGGRWHDPNKRSTTCRVEEGRYDDAARAAIEAMREPTMRMIEAGAIQHKLERNIPGHPNPELSSAAQCWRGMVDDALGQTQK